MKYVMAADQVVPITGTIGNTVYPPGSSRIMDVNFLNFEHTDGLNIVSLEYEKQIPLDWFGPRIPARGFALGGIGFVLPKSNVTLNMLGRARNDEFHLAGYSVGAGAGLEVDVYKNFFTRGTYKFGFVNLAVAFFLFAAAHSPQLVQYQTHSADANGTVCHIERGEMPAVKQGVEKVPVEV